MNRRNWFAEALGSIWVFFGMMSLLKINNPVKQEPLKVGDWLVTDKISPITVTLPIAFNGVELKLPVGAHIGTITCSQEHLNTCTLNSIRIQFTLPANPPE